MKIAIIGVDDKINARAAITALNIIGKHNDKDFVCVNADATNDEMNEVINHLATITARSRNEITGLINDMIMAGKERPNLDEIDKELYMISDKIQLAPPKQKKPGWRRPYKFHK